MALLVFEGIRKSYGDVQAVRDVSFEVREGEVFGLLGPNGAGKTTLIRILMDIIRPDDGAMKLFGRAHEIGALHRVGYLPEERGLYRKQKVLDVMVYFAMLKGLSRSEARERARCRLERIGMPDAAGKRVEQLSKGMSQKVQIASTLLNDPELCVLDEPFTGLDPVNVGLVKDLIHERRDAGRTTILSTHQMNMVEVLCDRVGLIDRGRLVVYGPVDEVRERYSKPEVRVTLEGTPPDIAAVVESVHEEGTTWRLLLEAGTRPRDVLSALMAAGAKVDHFERVLAPMEEIFIRVVENRA